MTVPIKHRKAAEGSIISYDGTDFVTGVAYKRYFGAMGDDESGDTFFLTTLAVDSKSYREFGTWTDDNTPASRIDRDFDLIFETTQQIEGKIILNMSFDAEAGAGDATGFVIVKFFHVNGGGSETQLGGTIQSDSIVVSSPAGKGKRLLIETDIPKTQFKEGEKLRVNIDVWGNGTAATDDGNVTLYFDPTNRLPTEFGDSDHTTSDSTLTVDVPFVPIL